MKRFLTKHGILVLTFAVLLTATLGLVSYFSSNTDVFTNVVNVVASPFRSASAEVSAWWEGRQRRAARLDELEEENYQLKLQIAEMEEALRQAEQDSQENALLRELLDLREQRRDLHWESALVTGQDSSNWASTLTLNVGTGYGVEIGDCVITEAGYLVGAITDVGSNWSTCTTVIDTDSAFGARVFRTGETVVARGEFSLMARNKLELNYLSEQSGLLAGDLIVTSGLGDYYPAGLVIGYVDEIKPDDDGLARHAILTPAAELDALRQVFVVKDFDIVP